MTKVFLGGTCNESTWRNRLIEKLNIDYFNPVVDDWTPECQQEERRQREICDLVLYVITPLMSGVYSICEVTDDSNKRPEKTIFCLLKKDDGKEFTTSEYKSLCEVARTVKSNGAQVFFNLDDVAKYCNERNEINWNQ